MFHRQLKVFTAAASVALLFVAHWANAQEVSEKATKTRADIDSDVADALEEFREIRGAQALFDKAAGYAVFRVTKGGLGASGAGGGGVAVDKTTGKRTYMRMGSAGVGLTVGLSRYNVVILFETQPKIDAFVHGGWDSAATAQAAAGTSGAQVSSTFFEGVAYFQLGRRGLMASADVSGTRFWVADELN
jgi:lipid-binding SYLF domain-containing protein